MMSKYKGIFVSVALDGVNDIITKSKLEAVNKALSDNYDHFEVIVVDSEKHRANIGDALKEINSCRVITIFDKPGISLHAVGVENSIGDLCVYGSVDTMTASNINNIVEKCCNGDDVVFGTSDLVAGKFKLLDKIALMFKHAFNYNIPEDAVNFGCVSRRAINALIETNIFLKEFEYKISNIVNGCASVEVNSTMPVQSKLDIFDLMILNTTQPLQWLHWMGCISFALVFALMLVGAGLVPALFCFGSFALGMFAYVIKFISTLLVVNQDNRPYFVMSDQHSSVMLKPDELNVVSESTSDTENKTQTGRDR